MIRYGELYTVYVVKGPRNGEAAPATEAATEKIQYRVTNWPEDDRALVRRGRLTRRFCKTASGRPRPASGGRRFSTRIAIQALLTLKAVFDLTYPEGGKGWPVRSSSCWGWHQPKLVGCSSAD